MRAIILSDSHGDQKACVRAVEASGKADMIIHLGDIERDVKFLRELYSSIPVYSVIGNNDFFINGNTEAVVEFADNKIFLCHGHTYGVRSGTSGLEIAAKKAGCNIALFGHTHKPLIKNSNGILIINPGSVAYPRFGSPSFAILEYMEDGSEEDVKGIIVDWVL